MWREFLFLLLLPWSCVYITLRKIQKVSLVPVEGSTGGDNGRHPLGSSPPFTPHMWGRILESLGQVIQR